MYEIENEVDVTGEEIEREITDTDRFLGEAFRVSSSGTIRGGIMVPKKECPATLVEVYNRMAKEEKPWAEMANTMGNDPKGKNWLTMKNVDYFTVRPCDCANSEHAALLKKLFGNGTGVIRKIPIAFPVNDVSLLISVSLSCYGTSGKKYQGRYIKDHLFCEYLKAEQQTGKEIKRFGPPKVERKPCNPEECAEYQSGVCKLRGGFVFRIPNISGLGVWRYYTRSWYGLVELRSKLKIIKELIKGRCSLTALSGYFYLTKIKVKVGRPLREQYITTIDTDFTLEQIVAEVEKNRLLGVGRTLVAASSAASLLNGGLKPHLPESTINVPAVDVNSPESKKQEIEEPDRGGKIAETETAAKELQMVRVELNKFCLSEKLPSETLKRCAEEQYGKPLLDMTVEELCAFTDSVKNEIKRDKAAWMTKWGEKNKETGKKTEAGKPTPAALNRPAEQWCPADIQDYTMI